MRSSSADSSTAAAAEYRRALLLDPATVDGWNGLGCAELARGAYGEAAMHCGAPSALRPERLDVRFNLAKALFELGEVDAARRLPIATVAEVGPSPLAARGARGHRLHHSRCARRPTTRPC